MKNIYRVAAAAARRSAPAVARGVRRAALAHDAVLATRMTGMAGMHVRHFSAALPPFTAMNMPALSPTMAHGTIASWEKKEGDALNPGDVIAKVETDKATVDFECQESGFLGRILVSAPAADVTVGRVVALMVDSVEAAAALKAIPVEELLNRVGGGSAAKAAAPAPAPAAAAPAPAPAAAAPAPAPAAAAAPAASAAAAGGRVVASPYAKKLATEAGIPISALAGAGTGPNGRIIAADVKEYKPPAAAPAAAAAAVAAPAPAAATSAAVADARSGYVDIPHSQMRRVIAHRLTTSKQTVPHYYLTSDVALDAVLALRATLNADLPADGKLSVNDFLIKASALACKKVPEVNASWLDNVIRSYDYVDVSVAVAIPDGLITPVVRDAQNKGLLSISSSVKGLVEKARAKKLMPEDYQGGTFTISNLGMFGIRQFSAIVNPPQAAILAVGAAERRVVPDATPGAAVPYKQSVVMAATLSCDHRVVDGAVGAQWLAAFKGYLENPSTMLL